MCRFSVNAIPAQRSRLTEPRPPGARLFTLQRTEDVHGVSGTGTVAEGVIFADGTTVMRWLLATATTVHYASIVDVIEIHGHDGRTTVVYT